MLCLSGFELYSCWVPLKTLHQNNFKHIASFCTLSEGYKCNKLHEIMRKEKASNFTK